MTFIKTFKGYEDKPGDLDEAVNQWLQQHGVEVVDLKTALSHEPGARARSGDLLYTIMYRAEAPLP